MQVDLLQAIRKMLAAQDLQVTVVEPPFKGLEAFDFGLRNALDPVFDWEDFGHRLVEGCPENTLIFAEDLFELRYALFRLPDADEAVCLMGPWTSGARTEKQMRRVESMMGPEAAAAVRDYYNAVRVVNTESLSPMISALVSLAFPEEEFRVRETREFLPLNFIPDVRYFSEPAFEKEIPASLLEQRYAAEGRLLDAVARGDTDAALQAVNMLGRFKIEGRFTDTPYQVKALLTVLNSLFRKAIEGSKVHPYYIDDISARYARLIENMQVADRSELIGRMIREYCAYVRKYSLKEYSPLVQKVINHINLNLGSELSLKSLAAMCFLSPSYLSNLFKRETGSTLIDYINTQRIQRAAHLLESTKLNVTVIAESVGILDVNYFAKVFKKATGQTPTQYRRIHALKQ